MATVIVNTILPRGDFSMSKEGKFYKERDCIF